jgi:hypothetical protein
MAGRRSRITASPRERIVDQTLRLAEEVGWQNLRLFQVAQRSGLRLADLAAEFRDLDAIADAWLARGVAAMLATAERPGFAGLPPRRRVELALTAFLEALSGHRRVAGQIFGAKLYLGHPHHNWSLVLWTSRTVQWLREAARLDGGGSRRRVEEIGLTALFIATLMRWLGDASADQAATRAFLAARLDRAERIMSRWFPQ